MTFYRRLIAPSAPAVVIPIRPVVGGVFLFQAKTKRPNSAAIVTSHTELRRKRISKTRLTASMATVVKSTSAARPSCQVTTAINDNEAALIPSRAAPAVRDLRIRGTSGPLTATKKKAGRNIPTVATIAPGTPPRTYPINVAVVKTGPGVT